MDKIKFFIFAFVLTGCLKEYCDENEMISNANPLQLWLKGTQTYNQKQVCGINPVCFCQPYNSSDLVQVQYPTSEPAMYKLQILDSNEVVLHELAMTPSGIAPDYIYQVEFYPETYSLIGNYGIRIVRTIDLQNEEFSTGAFWTNFGTGVDFSISGGSANASINPSPDNVTKAFRQELFIPVGEHSFQIQYTVSSILSGLGRATPRVHFYNGSTLLTTLTGTQTTGAGTFTNTFITLASPANVTHLGFSVLADASSTYDLSVDYFRMTGITEEITEISCIDVKESHDCSVLIKYSNGSDFAGLSYDGSPTPEFYLRVPGVFFHEEFPIEEEVIELSDDTFVRTYSKVEAKKRLDLGFMPYYMHTKMNLVLQHDFIEIDGDAWVKKDDYDIEAGNRRYPLKKASVLLTDKDFIKRNLL